MYTREVLRLAVHTVVRFSQEFLVVHRDSLKNVVRVCMGSDDLDHQHCLFVYAGAQRHAI